MESKALINDVLSLKPVERIQLIELIIKSLDQPDEKIEQIWAEESEKRYNALKSGKIKTIPLDDIVKKYK